MRVALLNGCFDGLHDGHKYLLTEAAKVSDHVAIAINSDASVRQLKGEGRPINPLADRCRAIQEFMPSASINVFETEDALLNLILYFRPDYLVKGSDWIDLPVTGAEELEQWGGSIVFIDRLPNISTTETVDK